MSFPDIVTEDTRVVAKAAGVGDTAIHIPHAAITGEHRQRMLHEAPQVPLVHAVVDRAAAASDLDGEDQFDLIVHAIASPPQLRCGGEAHPTKLRITVASGDDDVAVVPALAALEHVLHLLDHFCALDRIAEALLDLCAGAL